MTTNTTYVKRTPSSTTSGSDREVCLLAVWCQIQQIIEDLYQGGAKVRFVKFGQSSSNRYSDSNDHIILTITDMIRTQVMPAYICFFQ